MWHRAILASCLTLLLATFAHAQQRTFTIGTGAADGNYYSVGGALCRMVNRRDDARCLIQETAGSVENLYALDVGEIDFAIMQADVQSAAYGGSSRLVDGPYDELRSIFTLYPEMLAIVVRSDRGIRSMVDLRGRRVNSGKLNSGTRWIFETALAAHGIRTFELGAQYASSAFSGAVDLCAGRVDALAIMSGQPSAIMMRLSDTCPVTILPLDPRAVAAMVRRNPNYKATFIPGGLYSAAPRPVSTVGTSATLVALEGTDGALVSALVQGVYADVEAFRRQQIVLGDDSPSRDRLVAPLHPAAARFYHENFARP